MILLRGIPPRHTTGYRNPRAKEKVEFAVTAGRGNVLERGRL